MRRFKTHIAPLRNALGTVARLRGVSYNDKTSGKAQVGVIAEEVAEVLPEVVGVGRDGQVDGVSYARLTALLIEATKEQQAQIRKLRRQAAGRDAELGRLARKVAEMQKVQRIRSAASRTVNDARQTSLLIKAVKQQQAQIQELKTQLGELNARLDGRTELARR